MEHLVSLHHLEQKLIFRSVILQLHPIWEILDPKDLKRTTAPWLKVARPIVEEGHSQSRNVAAEFVKNYRSAILPDAEPLDAEKPQVDKLILLKIAASLRVTGPDWVSYRSNPQMDQPQLEEVMRLGFSKNTGAAMRLVLNGGRGAVYSLVKSDPLARGVAAVADPQACNGCLFLTTPIMKSAGNKRMAAVSVGHDFCNCSAIPVY